MSSIGLPKLLFLLAMAGSVLLSAVLLVPITMMLKSMQKSYKKQIESLVVMLIYLVVYNIACIYYYTFLIVGNLKTIKLPYYELIQQAGNAVLMFTWL